MAKTNYKNDIERLTITMNEAFNLAVVLNKERLALEKKAEDMTITIKTLRNELQEVIIHTTTYYNAQGDVNIEAAKDLVKRITAMHEL